jgi:hypothetical protein
MVNCLDCDRKINDKEVKYSCQCYRCCDKNSYRDDKHIRTFLCIDCVCDFFKNNYEFYETHKYISAKDHIKYAINELQFISDDSEEYTPPELIYDTGTHYTNWIYSPDYESDD